LEQGILLGLHPNILAIEDAIILVKTFFFAQPRKEPSISIYILQPEAYIFFENECQNYVICGFKMQVFVATAQDLQDKNCFINFPEVSFLFFLFQGMQNKTKRKKKTF
jgi:hypothetical protein